MPVQLLPASAAAFAPRGSVQVVLGAKPEQWLTQTLKRVNRVKRPLNNVQQHTKCLTDILSSKNAIWTLASLIVPKAPAAELGQDEGVLMHRFDMVHVEAYIVHVDMVHCNEVAFKLTTDTIDALVRYHKDVYCVDAKADTRDWPDKEQQCKKLHQDFVQAVNRFVFRAPATALEGMEDEGAGELLCGRSDEAKASLTNLIKPLLPPPPPKVVAEVARPPPLLPSSPSTVASMWAQPVQPAAVVDAWRVLPSNSPVSSSAAASVVTSPESTAPSMWSSAAAAMTMAEHHSPSSCYSSPETAFHHVDVAPAGYHSPPQAYHSPPQAYHSPPQAAYHSPPPQVYHSPPQAAYSSPPQVYHTPYTTADMYWPAAPISAPIALPSMLTPHCGLGMSPFGWDNRYTDYAATM